MAIQAAKAGNKEGARVMFRQVLNEDRRNERALMWLAKIAPNTTERRRWLQHVLTIDPNNQAAKTALKQMDYKTSARDNRVLIIFGVVALVLVALAVVIFIAVTIF
jgi:hypothetical protein